MAASAPHRLGLTDLRLTFWSLTCIRGHTRTLFGPTFRAEDITLKPLIGVPTLQPTGTYYAADTDRSRCWRMSWIASTSVQMLGP